VEIDPDDPSRQALGLQKLKEASWDIRIDWNIKKPDDRRMIAYMARMGFFS
jgi:hypothetical protein